MFRNLFKAPGIAVRRRPGVLVMATVLVLSGTVSDGFASDPVPYVALKPNSSQVAPGGSFTISWTTSSASSCNKSGSWTGTAPTLPNGNSSVTAPSQAGYYQYIFTCTNADNSASTAATLTIQVGGILSFAKYGGPPLTGTPPSLSVYPVIEANSVVNVPVFLEPAQSSPTTFSFSVSGTAVAGKNFTVSSNPITIPAGATSTHIPVSMKDDYFRDPGNTVILTLQAPATTGVVLGQPESFELAIEDNDSLVLSQRWSTLSPQFSNAWTNISDSAVAGYVGGGPLMIQMNVSMGVSGSQSTGQGTCRPIIDGQWAGSYSGETVANNDPFNTEGSISVSELSFVRSRIYLGVPAGTHQFEIQCAGTAGGVVNPPTGSAAPFNQNFSSWSVVELRSP